jgi:regulator of sigma E protease
MRVAHFPFADGLLLVLGVLWCTDGALAFTAAPLHTQSHLDSKNGVFGNGKLTDNRFFGKADTVRPISTPRGSAVGNLKASPLVALLSSPLGSVGVLASIVLVHEMGHYLAARSFGISVEEFSIGFGPKLLGFRAFGDEFNLRALPLGGYVRFPENYNATRVREMEEAAYLAAKENGALEKPDAASEILNMVTFGAVEARQQREKEQQLLQQVEEFNNLPFWKKMVKTPPQKSLDRGNVEIEYYDDPKLLQNRPWQERAVVLSGGVVFNLLLSFSIYFGQISVGPGLPQPVFDRGIVINAAPTSNAAASGLLRKGDIVYEINGSPVSVSSSPSPYEAQKSINEFIAKIRTAPEGQPIKLVVRHPNEKELVNVDVVPKKLDAAGPQTIGVLLAPNYIKSEVLRTDNVGEAASLAYKYAYSLTSQTAAGLGSLFGDLFSGKAGSSSNQVSGPIGLIRTGSEVVATQDLTTVLLFAAAISINLGVVNALPLPALDG